MMFTLAQIICDWPNERFTSSCVFLETEIMVEALFDLKPPKNSES